MAMAADVDPLSDRELSEEDGGDPVEEEVLETPTEVRLLVGTLVELILAGRVAEPGPPPGKHFRRGGPAQEADRLSGEETGTA